MGGLGSEAEVVDLRFDILGGGGFVFGGFVEGLGEWMGE